MDIKNEKIVRGNKEEWKKENIEWKEDNIRIEKVERGKDRIIMRLFGRKVIEIEKMSGNEWRLWIGKEERLWIVGKER